MQELPAIRRVCQSCLAEFAEDNEIDRCPYDDSLLSLQITDHLIGSKLQDRYKLVEILGVGGWGVVYKGYDETLTRHVAVKLLHLHLVGGGDKLERFKREARATSRLIEPTIATVYDFGLLQNGQPFLVMEFVEGVNLSALLSAEKQISWVEAAMICGQVCRALEAADRRNICHRDLKPDNIMLVNWRTADQSVKVLDFGLAKIGSGEVTTLTETGTTLGTPAYMSPEQCIGRKIDGRSDIYALGCVMYECLSGVQPFGEKSALAAMRKHIQERPPALSLIAPNSQIPPWFEGVVQHMLEKDPANRYQSAADVLTDLKHQKHSDRARMTRYVNRMVKLTVLITTCSLLISICVTQSIDHSAPPSTAVRSAPRQLSEWFNDPRFAVLSGYAQPKTLNKTELKNVLAIFDQAIKLQPNDDQLYNNRALTQFELGKFDKALADYQKAMQMNPMNPNIYYNLAALFHKLHLWTACTELCDKALTLTPKTPELYYYRAVSYRECGLYREALADMDKAIALTRNKFAQYYGERAIINCRLHQYGEALSDANKSIALDPRLSTGFSARGLTFAALAKPAKARQAMDFAIKSKSRSAETYNNCGQAMLTLGDMNSALQSFDSSLQLDEGVASVHAWRSHVFALLGRQRKSNLDLEKALFLQPESKEYLTRLAAGKI